MKTIATLAAAVLLSGCAPQIRYKTVNVPVITPCVATVPTKPARMTPCPPTATDAQCVQRAAIDIERLDAALDETINLLGACK